MTRIAVLSDLHGNLPALEAIITDLPEHAPDMVLVAGDMVNFGPFSAEVLARIFELGWAVIRGNHEFYLLDYQTPREPAHWHDYTTPRWLHATIPLTLQRRVAALPDTLTLYFADAPPVRVVHGLPTTHWDGIYPSTSDAVFVEHFAPVREETIIAGHIHLTHERFVEHGERRWHFINPGSAGLPADGKPTTAPYAILDGDASGWQASFHRAVYDPSTLLAALTAPEYRAAHGPYARLFEAEFHTCRIRVWPFQRWRADCYPGQPATDAMVEEFLALSGEQVRPWVPESFSYE